MKFLCSSILFFLFTTNMAAQQKAMPAGQILSVAYKQAADSNKNVLLIFHASWCGWCKKMDSAINDASCKKLFDDNYIIEHLTTNETADKKHLENLGAKEILAHYKAATSGLPVWLVLDKYGNLLGDSFIKEKGKATINIGCPANEDEVKKFVKTLKQTSKLTDKELCIIATRFRQNE
jgi:thioredoxin-related protein